MALNPTLRARLAKYPPALTKIPLDKQNGPCYTLHMDDRMLTKLKIHEKDSIEIRAEKIKSRLRALDVERRSVSARLYTLELEEKELYQSIDELYTHDERNRPKMHITRSDVAGTCKVCGEKTRNRVNGATICIRHDIRYQISDHKVMLSNGRMASQSSLLEELMNEGEQ